REVSTRGSLAAAAAALGQDPSSVSHQLKALEAEVGAPLLERVGRGVRLTEEALILVTRTEAVLSELEAAEADIGRGPARGVRHGAHRGLPDRSAHNRSRCAGAPGPGSSRSQGRNDPHQGR